MNWLFNDISVIYVTANRCAGGLKKKKDLRSGSQHQRFVGFFKITYPSKHRYGGILFIRLFRETSHLVAFYDKLGIRRTHSRLKPPGSSRGKRSKETGGIEWEGKLRTICAREARAAPRRREGDKGGREEAYHTPSTLY